MRRNQIVLVVFIISVIILLLVYQYILSIYEITYSVKPENLFADFTSTVTIASVPLNSFGKEAPFRTAPVKFEIKEGEELIDIVVENDNEGYIVLRAKGEAGTVVVIARSNKSLLPSLIEVPIYPELAQE